MGKAPLFTADIDFALFLILITAAVVVCVVTYIDVSGRWATFRNRASRSGVDPVDTGAQPAQQTPVGDASATVSTSPRRVTS